MYEINNEPSLHYKDTSSIQEEQVIGEHTSQIDTEYTQGIENATVKHEDIPIQTQKSIDMYQSHPYEDDVSHK